VTGHYDVVICGGGDAGLLLARHLQLTQPERRLLVLDRASVPSPEACHKVGESIPEASAYYLHHTLGLGEHLFGRQIVKFGLRFFFDGGNGRAFADRLEYGGIQWPPVATFQLDRGRFENAVRAIVAAGGAEVRPRCAVSEVALDGAGGPHRITFRCDGGEPTTVTARWLIDATGRRRLLARQLGLAEDSPHRASASWMRVDRRIDVADLVGPENCEWHQRTGPPRFHSTVHLAGDNYWVWVIPLAGERTSVGVVACEAAHPVAERGSVGRTMRWLERHEPEFAALVADAPVLDFRAIRHFSYATRRAFGASRWACVGESGAFGDPLYSFGQEMISHANNMVERMIRADFEGGFTPALCDRYERVFQKLFRLVLDHYTGCYPVLGSPFLGAQKLAWDSSLYFAVLQQTVCQNVYDDPGGVEALEPTLDRLIVVNRAMQDLFIEARKRGVREDYEGMRTWAPRVTALADASIEKCPAGGFAAFYARRLAELEGIGATLFAQLLDHCPWIPPDAVERVRGADGIDLSRASLDPAAWDGAGLIPARGGAGGSDEPAEWDARRRIAAERRDFKPVGELFLETAARYGDAAALDEAGAALSYDGLIRRVERQAARFRGTAAQGTAIAPRPASEALVAMLASARAGRPFMLLDLPVAGALPVPSPADAAVGLGRHIAFRRLAAHGGAAGAVDHDQLAWWRMCGWLARLLDGAPGRTCLWLGPASEEMAALALLGCRIVAREEAERDLPPCELVVARPEALARLDGRPWLGETTLVGIRAPLPTPLLLRLRAQCARLLDFGYVVFAH